MSDLITRPLDPFVDGADLVQLFEDVFGATVTPYMWQWKYMPPWTERFYCWVARVDERTIGYAGAVPLPGQVDGKEMPFFQLADFMVHPDYRLKYDFFGIGSKHILETIVDTHPRHLIYGFSNHRAFLWMKRLGICDLVRKEQTRYFRLEEAEAATPYVFEAGDWSTEELDAAWSRLAHEHRISLVRDSRYVAWRYRDHPVNRYRMLRVRAANGEAIGWCVLGDDGAGKRGRPPETPLVDMLLPKDELEGVLRALPTHLGTDVMTWLPEPKLALSGETASSGTNVYHFTKGCELGTSELQSDLYYTMGDVDWW